MASYYNLIEYDSDSEGPIIVSMSNLTAAAIFMTGVLQRASIPYGLMGGLAVRYIGGKSHTKDVDMAFQAGMRRLWEVVEVEPRLTIPNTRLISNIMKDFVRTGPGYDSCVQNMEVEVDLIESGFQNSPRDLAETIMMHTIPSDAGPVQIRGISLLYLLRGKMAAFAGRAQTSDMQDIQTILLNRLEEVRGFVGSLEPLGVDVFLERMPRQNQGYWRSFFARCF
ncbi:uncharacterized protein BDV17DRAFT_148398 [Aspergillus undulatus]|uniref:uncharacterized protein n=1 Tax=Aspergillus undulatus TaxID=1810928 RepID=UPI003CCD187D